MVLLGWLDVWLICLTTEAHKVYSYNYFKFNKFQYHIGVYGEHNTELVGRQFCLLVGKPDEQKQFACVTIGNYVSQLNAFGYLQDTSKKTLTQNETTISDIDLVDDVGT